VLRYLRLEALQRCQRHAVGSDRLHGPARYPDAKRPLECGGTGTQIRTRTSRVCNLPLPGQCLATIKGER